MSDTPKTDALEKECQRQAFSWDQAGPKYATLARQLECELADAKDDVKRLHGDKMALLEKYEFKA